MLNLNICQQSWIIKQQKQLLSQYQIQNQKLTIKIELYIISAIPELIQKFKKKIATADNYLGQNFEDLLLEQEVISSFNNHDLSEITNQQQIQPVQQSIEEYNPLNYEKIILLLTKSQNTILVATVLQALRWRITRAGSALERKSVIVAYQTHDLLGIHQRNTMLAKNLMFKAEPMVQCQTLKLMNALASDYNGRTYLTQNSYLIKLLIEFLKQNQTDSIQRQNAIKSLQKISLRKQSQFWMLDTDVIYVGLTILQREKFILSENQYEYLIALIMNLSMNPSGRDQLYMNKELVFEVLFELIEYPNDQIRLFTNAIFYSMFSRREFRDYAFQLNIHQKLPKLLSVSEEKFKKQLQLMIEQLESNDDDNQSFIDEDNDLEDEEEFSVDDEDEDLDNNDMVIGEELLKNEFALDNDQVEQQRQLMELQQRNIFKEQLTDSQLEKMPVEQGPFIGNNLMSINVNHNQVQPQTQSFVSRPKISRTLPNQQQNYQN